MPKELYNSSSFKGYSLWLSPKTESPVSNLLQTLITTASKTFSSPNFQPHVTLLGAIEASAEEVIEKTRELTTKLKVNKIHLELDQIAVGEAYFQCVLWKVANNSSTKTLREANQLAREIFEKKLEPVYFPHLSLVYGDFTHSERLNIREKMGKMGEMDSNDLVIQELSFDVDRILVVNTEGEPREWQVIAEIELNGGLPTSNTD